MTTTAQRRTSGRVAAWRTGPTVRAARVELRLQLEAFAGSMILAALALVVAIVSTPFLTGLAPLWAALAWQRYGRADVPEAVAFKAALGISPAERVRGRVALVGLETLVLILVATAGTVIGMVRGDGGSMAPLSDALGGPWGAVLTAFCVVLGSITVLSLVGVSVGRECTTRRPGWGMFAISLVVFFGASLLSALVVLLPAEILQAVMPRPWGTVCVVAYLLVAATFALLFLRARVRSWIRGLDRDARRS